MAVLASYGTDGKININQLNDNLAKVEGISDFESITEEKLEEGVIVIVDGYEVTIYGTGEITVNKGTNNPPIIEESQLEKSIESGNVLDTNKPTIITDKYGNEIKVPEGFKIASDSATDVTGGVVIEDATDEPTKGSQFVWIPVGTVYTNENQTTSETIELNRYRIENDNLVAINEERFGSYYQELETSNFGNTTAKNLGVFKSSVMTNSGYYIGRYEARTERERTKGTDDDGLGAVTVKTNEFVYNYVTQPQAADLSRNMYQNKMFESDLINSYAWDTALVFIQTFGQNDYAIKHFPNLKEWGKKGTNNLADVIAQDKECNIWDMAANYLEYTTETSSLHGATFRNGSAPAGAVAPINRFDYDGGAGGNFSFRIVLYL